MNHFLTTPIFILSLSFAASLLTALFLTPMVRDFAKSVNVMDHPNERKVHPHPKPLLGGIGVFVATFAATGGSLLLYKHTGGFVAHVYFKQLLGLIAGSTLIFFLGFIDDILALGPKTKLAWQLVAAIILFNFGISITYLRLPVAGYIFLPGWASFLLTIGWIVAITNAVNLLDGLDGLLAGVAVITSLVFALLCVLQGQLVTAAVLAALAGACLGFLRYNFYPSQIFLGDTGSLFIGVMLASTSILGAFKTTAVTALLVPLVLLAIPIFDAAFAVIRRLASGKPIMAPDAGHVHHRLLQLGLSQRKTVALIYILNLLCGIVAVLAVLLFNK